MRFLSWWRGQRRHDPAGNRLARFRKVLEIAQTLPLYQPALRSAQLDTRKALKRITDVNSVLSCLGVFSLEQVSVRPRREPHSPVVFTSPLSQGVTPELYWNSAGSAVLQKGASGSKRGHHAIFIRIGINEGLLSPIERDGLWQRHGVPMFEHLVGLDGQLLAWECETHSGLHVVEENAIFECVAGELLLTSLTDLVQPTIQMRTGWAARIESEPCDCGRPGDRLIGIRPLLWLKRPSQQAEGLAIAAHT